MRKITDDIDQVLFTEEQLAKRVSELGAMISSDYRDKDLLIVGILKGAGIFMSDLIRRIDGDATTDYMVVSSYGNETVSSENLKILKDVQQPVAGMHVLLTEDIVDTGLTLSTLKDLMMTRKAASVRICTLLDKPSGRAVPVEVDYSGFEVPDAFIVGYGIDYAEKYRNLPFIATLKKEICEKK